MVTQNLSPDTFDAPVAGFRAAHADQLPEFVPLPTGDHVEFYSGLKRGKLNQLILPGGQNGGVPPVRSISLRPRGSTKGKRLIVLSSLLEYLRRQGV